jgi:hypothetical protein
MGRTSWPPPAPLRWGGNCRRNWCVFGGIKQPGINRYHGPAGLRLFAEPRSLVIDDGVNDTEPTWFPYDQAKLQAARERCAGGRAVEPAPRD